MVCCALRHGRWMARTVRRTHAAASGVRSTAHTAEVERMSTRFESLPKGRPHRDAEFCTAARARRALHDAPALVIHRVARVSKRKDACIEAYHVPKPRSGPVPPGCMRYRMRRAACDVHVAPARAACCVGARCACCIGYALRFASEQLIASYVASTCRIDACCIVALARVACRIGERWRVASVRVLQRCALHRRALHRLVASACVASAPVASAPRSRPQRRCRVMHCSNCCGCAARSGKGRAVAVAERRRDALVRSTTAAACSPWPAAPRCSTPWRYPTP